MISPEVWLPPYTPFDHPLSPQNFFTSWPLILNHDLEVCLATLFWLKFFSIPPQLGPTEMFTGVNKILFSGPPTRFFGP